MAFKPIQIKITEDQKRRARELYNFKALKGSIMKGKSNIFGALGEILVLDHYKRLGVEIEHSQHYDYDFLIGGRRVDVKTKKANYKPNPTYRANIPAYNTRQKTEFYFWVNIPEDLSRAYLIGYISKERFFKEARFCQKGEHDRGEFYFRADCYTITVDKLTPFKRSPL